MNRRERGESGDGEGQLFRRADDARECGVCLGTLATVVPPVRRQAPRQLTSVGLGGSLDRVLLFANAKPRFVGDAKLRTCANWLTCPKPKTPSVYRYDEIPSRYPYGRDPYPRKG